MSLSSTLVWCIPLPFIAAAEAMPADGSGVTATMIGQAILFLTTLVGILVQIYRENRAHRWAKEEADELAKKVEQEALKVSRETERIVRHVGRNMEQIVSSNADEAREARDEIKTQLAVNTKLTEMAANNTGQHLYKNEDGTPKTIQVEVMNDKDHSVPVDPVEVKQNATPKNTL